jgi:hypothetical protein
LELSWSSRAASLQPTQRGIDHFLRLYFYLIEHDLDVFHANVTILDILDGLLHDQTDDILSDQVLDFNRTGLSRGSQFQAMAAIEVKGLGRNRRTEQIGRGGFPHSSVFRRTKHERFWTYANPDYQKYAIKEKSLIDEESEDASEVDANGDE